MPVPLRCAIVGLDRLTSLCAFSKNSARNSVFADGEGSDSCWPDGPGKEDNDGYKT
jgi:hypothetical protein